MATAAEHGNVRLEKYVSRTAVYSMWVLLSKANLLRVGAKGGVQWTPSDPAGHVVSIRFRVAVNYAGERSVCVNYDWSDDEGDRNDQDLDQARDDPA